MTEQMRVTMHCDDENDVAIVEGGDGCDADGSDTDDG